MNIGTFGLRRQPRRHFEVDRYTIAHAAIVALAAEGKMCTIIGP